MYSTMYPDIANAARNVRLFTNTMPYYSSVYSPPGFQETYDEAMGTFDPKKLRDLTQKMFRILYDSAMVTPMFIETQLAAQTKKVHDTGWCEIAFNTFTPENAWLSK